MFTITNHKGFHMKFANGWTVSVQWGPGNYSDNYGAEYHAAQRADCWESRTAECAVFNPSGKLVKLNTDGYEVRGGMTADEVAVLIQQVASGTMWFMVNEPPMPKGWDKVDAGMEESINANMRKLGKALERAYPWGYRSKDTEA